jgi:hypothetical protein
MFWRYQLILTEGYSVYPSGTSPQIQQFAEFTSEHCAEYQKIGYFSTKYNTISRARYTLYPQQLIKLSSPLDTTLIENGEEDSYCLMVDFADVRPPLTGEIITFSASQYLIIAH